MPDVEINCLFPISASIFGFASVPWLLLLPIAASYVGRKLPYVFACIVTLVSSIVLYCSNSIIEIIVSECLLSIVGSALITVSYMILGEYISPKYRGLFLTLKSANLFWGIWVSNAIGTFFYWRNIPLVMIILSIYSIVLVIFWPESPYFLASKLKFDKCAQSHRWLKGTSKKSEKELSKLVSESNVLVSKETGFFEVVFKKRFYKAFLVCACLFAAHTLSGKLVCGMYSLDIIKKMTSSEAAAYTGMLILDGVTVISMYIGSILSKTVKRRVILISSSSIGIVSLFALSLYTYLVQVLSVLQENAYITIVLLSLYSVGIGCGPMIMSTSLVCEIIPIQYKGFALCTLGIHDKLLSATILKLTPVVIRKFGLHFAFLIFAVLSTIFLFLIFLYMPETKDKTLYEISDEMQNEHEKENDKDKDHGGLVM